MKNFFSTAVISLFISIHAHAESISKEKYKELMLESQQAYEMVEPGMSYVGVGVSSVITDESGTDFPCRQAVESTVVQVYGTQYLTYEKVKALNNCGSSQTEGQVEEFLQWNKLYSVQEHLQVLDDRLNVTSINLRGSFVELRGETKGSVSFEPRKFKRLMNIQESQFFNIKSYNDGMFSWSQFYTRTVDPSTLSLAGLEVRDLNY